MYVNVKRKGKVQKEKMWVEFNIYNKSREKTSQDKTHWWLGTIEWFQMDTASAPLLACQINDFGV